VLVNSVVNLDTAVEKDRLYQDYIQECQVLLSERPELAKKLAIDLTSMVPWTYRYRNNRNSSSL
jgi:hypothetical protein